MNTTAKYRWPSCHAFTLVELLVVIGIIGLLVSILLPSLWRARSLAQRSACGNNIRDIVRGCLSYAQDGGWNRRDPASNYTPDKPFISAALPSIGPTGANWGDLKFGNPGCLWLLLTGRYPADTTNSIKQAWTGMAVVYCPEAAGPRGLRAPMLSDGQMVAETSSYGYLSQVPIDLAASGTVQHVIYTGTSIHEAKAGLVIVADSNPHCTPGQNTWSNPASCWNATENSYNSPNHRAEGQNAGKLDGSVRWSPTSTIDDDDIYTPGAAGSTAEGRRSEINDSLILD